MATNQLDLVIDIQNRRLVRSFGANVSVSLPSLFQGDSQDIFLRFVKPTGRTDVAFEEIDPTSWTVKLGIGTISNPPTAGTFTLTYGADTTSAIAYNASAATVETALDALASVVSAGGVSVAGNAGGPWTVTFASNGSRTAISGTADALSPVSQVIGTTLQDGTASLKEIQSITLNQMPLAYQDTWGDAPSPTITISELQAGNASVNEIQKVELSQGVYGGSFALSYAGATSSMIPWNASGSDIQTALEALSTIGTGNVSVSGDVGGAWNVTFKGTLANTNLALMTSSASGLLSPKGKIATLALNTGAIEQALGSASSISSTFEVEVTPSGSYRMTVLQTTVSILNDLIEGAPAVPAPISDYYTTIESDNAYTQNRSSFTGLTGGGAGALDGLATLTRTVGQIVQFTTGTDTSFYQLKSGTDAESSPSIIRPDDYAGTTNEKVWKRLSIGIPKNTLIAYVDAAGSDTTGTIGDSTKPYLTPQAAYDAILAAANGTYAIHIGVGTFTGISIGTTAWPTGAKTIAITGEGVSVSLLGGITSNGVAINIVGDLKCNLGAIDTSQGATAVTGGAITLSRCYTTSVMKSIGSTLGGAISITDCFTAGVQSGRDIIGGGTCDTGGAISITRSTLTAGIASGGAIQGGSVTILNSYCTSTISRGYSGTAGAITITSSNLSSTVNCQGVTAGTLTILNSSAGNITASGTTGTGSTTTIADSVVGTVNTSSTVTAGNITATNSKVGGLTYGGSPTGTLTFLKSSYTLTSPTGTANQIRLERINSGGTANEEFNGATFLNTFLNATTRPTGWGAPTGTATRASLNTTTATATDVAQSLKALIDDLTTLGLIGA